MQIKPVCLSFNSVVRYYKQKYNIDSDSIISGKFIFELCGCNTDQKKQMTLLNKTHPDYFSVFMENNSQDILLEVLRKNWDQNSIYEKFNRDTELSSFFDKLYNFYSHPVMPVWKFNGKTLDFKKAPFIMGILNVTPDSFSDGGRYFDTSKAVDHALAMAESGADIIDIGGESTRPGSEPVNTEEESDRVIPVITELRKHTDMPLSIDTYKSAVAQEAIKAGADIINDISACTFDKEMPELIKRAGAPLIIMHIKGTPRDMQIAPEYDDVSQEVYAFLSDRVDILKEKGIENAAIDPGIGFGKRLEHNLELLNNLEIFHFINKPVLIGVSRKSFIGKILDREINERLIGSLSVAIMSALKGAAILRVHDVAETKEAMKIINKIQNAGVID